MHFEFALIAKFWSLLIFGMILVLIFYFYWSKGKPKTGSYLKKSFRIDNGILNYRIFYPTGFEKTKKYPVLLFLHGAGERGDDNVSQLILGGELFKKGMEIHQSIAIFPQCPEGIYWIKKLDAEDRPVGSHEIEPDAKNPPTEVMDKVIGLMNAITKENYVDNSRIYIAGLSMGGMGTFDICWRKPEMFAAAIAVCGVGSPLKAFRFAKMPIRIFHGDADEVVSVDESLEMIAALKELGGNPEAFIYPGVDHHSWNNAFAEPDFLSWLYEHEKK